ncbi:hypothetical protein G7068_16275 [Leucobacter viscericola]|uniref:Uncharacterized protein n=1 Tax=Leucobacter viscericola TaxID=2714935 RepID=A0A6G7XJ12_9MICO|nr:hypothetical protein [Leucobacter viscericola]QIK64532.1 hypothetical protein G7068_15915 [Leucobacter viscericola]QIK64604.1 hypothetical protein G7068_16275 [Leucobacter viscericola]
MGNDRNELTAPASARHAGAVEPWITARAYVNRYGSHRGKHGVTHGNPTRTERRTVARVRTAYRLLVSRPRHGRHGTTAPLSRGCEHWECQLLDVFCTFTTAKLAPAFS